MADSLKRLWAGWKKIAHAIGVFQTRLVLILLYDTLLLPFGLLVKVFMDPLRLKTRDRASGWVPRETRDRSLEDLKKQS